MILSENVSIGNFRACDCCYFVMMLVWVELGWVIVGEMWEKLMWSGGNLSWVKVNSVNFSQNVDLYEEICELSCDWIGIVWN